jgi:hypothetical protein
VADRDIAVKFTGDARDLEQASDKAERSISGAAKGMGSGLSAIAGPAAIAAGAIAGLGAVAFSFVDAALEDDAAAASLAQNLRTAAGASDEAIAGAEAYITTLSKTAAVADDELRPALSKLAVATGDTSKAQGLLALATDISAGTGKDLAAVSEAMAKAQNGNVGALGRLGIATKDAEGNTLSLDQVLAGATAKFHGAAEAAGNTAAGGLKKAQIGMGELQESIGAKLLPALGGLGQIFVDKVIPAFESIVAWVQTEWPKIQAQIEPSLRDLQATMDEVFTAIGEAWAEWGDEVAQVAGVILAFWVEYMVTEIKIFAAFVRFAVDQIKAFWAEYGDTIKFVAGFVKDAATTMAEVIGRAMFAISWAVSVASKAFSGDFAGAWAAVKAAAWTGVQFVVDVMSGIGNRIKDAMAGLAEIITRPFRIAFNSIADLWNNTVGALNFTFPDWVPGLGGRRVDVPDIPRFSALGVAGLTIVMPPGSDGYDIARQLSTFGRTVADPQALTVAVR